jgi:hypothetical protein
MNEEQVKHLELIVTVISRLARCSFSFKGWAITIVAGIFALASRGHAPWQYLAALIPVLAFWGLDAYYLRDERLFRRLYDAVRTAQPTAWREDAFSMNTRPYRASVQSWWRTCWTRTVVSLYAPMAIVVLAVAVIASMSWQ